MEIIMRDERIPKNCYECSYLNYCSLNPDFKPTVSKYPFQSLDQHDAEVRAEERKKVIDVFVELIIDCFKNYSINGKIIVCDNVFKNNIYFLQQKLAELKGEKDE